MSFNLLVHFPAPPDWPAVNRFVQPYLPVLETFPIASDAGEYCALGVSLPFHFASPDSCAALSQLLQQLQQRFGAAVVDLSAGDVLTHDDLLSIHTRVLR